MSKVEHLQTDIQRQLSKIYQTDVKDDRIGFITITAVKLTNDYSHLTVYYTILGDDEKKKEARRALEHSKKYVRTLLAQRVHMRKSPQIHFKYDESLEYGNRIERGLKKVLPDDDE
ncbi:MAG: 30S ribosome-binding factor RbfA [Candidatus Izemoplasma sp.]|nr:30S ribosome-binding factor RbfA [Candidatus Izemoplasma sp.]